MVAVIALVGRPNVGKSTLFNELTGSRAAIVADEPGVTRDRQFANLDYENYQAIVIDTGGLEGGETAAINLAMESQSKQAMLDADIIFFLVDANSGVVQGDIDLAAFIRPLNKPCYLLVNKIDGREPHGLCADFYQLGLGEPWPIAANRRGGLQALLQDALKDVPLLAQEDEDLSDDEATEDRRVAALSAPIRVAIVGRPNVGKSTLLNRMLGEERVIAHDMPGTTRDCIEVDIEHRGREYVFIDTAGVRRRTKVAEGIESFSVVKTLQAIDAAHVVLLLFNAREGIAEQDLKLIDFVLERGRGLLLVVNQWDGLDGDSKSMIQKELDRRLSFIHFARTVFISALHGSGVGELYKYINEAHRSAFCTLSSAKLTELLEQAVSSHPPPVVRGRRIKLRYAHPGGHNPPTVVIHGKQTSSLPGSYLRYLEKFFAKSLNLKGTPVRLLMRTDENPYQA